MNSKVTEAVERLFSACLEASMTGKCQAFMSYFANASTVHVEVFPAETRFGDGGAPKSLFFERIFIAGPAYREDQCLRQVNSLLAKLNSYLAAPTDDPNIALEWLKSGRSIRISAKSASDLSSHARALAELESRQAA